MSRPVSGKTTTYQYKVKKKNGYSYVYQRTEKYDPSTKRMIKVGSVVLLGKVKDDDPSQTILKTRPGSPPLRSRYPSRRFRPLRLPTRPRAVAPGNRQG